MTDNLWYRLSSFDSLLGGRKEVTSDYWLQNVEIPLASYFRILLKYLTCENNDKYRYMIKEHINAVFQCEFNPNVVNATCFVDEVNNPPAIVNSGNLCISLFFSLYYRTHITYIVNMALFDPNLPIKTKSNIIYSYDPNV